MKLRPKTTTTMNLSDNTLGILKNFAGINNSILVYKQYNSIFAAEKPMLISQDEFSNRFLI